MPNLATRIRRLGVQVGDASREAETLALFFHRGSGIIVFAPAAADEDGEPHDVVLVLDGGNVPVKEGLGGVEGSVGEVGEIVERSWGGGGGAGVEGSVGLEVGLWTKGMNQLMAEHNGEGWWGDGAHESRISRCLWVTQSRSESEGTRIQQRAVSDGVDGVV